MQFLRTRESKPLRDQPQQIIWGIDSVNRPLLNR